MGRITAESEIRGEELMKEISSLIAYRPDVKVVDATLRDGGLVNDFYFTDEFVKALYLANLRSGVDYMEFGYKASREMFDESKFGKWKFSKDEDIRAIVGENATDLKIAVMADVGRCDYKTDIIERADSPIDLIRVATYINTIPAAIEMLEDAKKKGYETGNVAAMYMKMILICAVILFITYKLAKYKGIPTSLVWVLIVVLIYGYITSKTTIGRYFYAVGGNEKATKLSGINTERVYFLAYTNMGLLSALAGMLTIARLTSAQPTYGQNYEMDAIGSCFIGGASAYGGTGTVPGVIIGATLMGIINQGMSIMGTDQNMQKVVKGLVLLAAVIFDVVSKKRSE